MVRATFAVTALQARGEDVGERELLLDLVDHLHVPHDLQGLVVHEAV